ncbi:hypothetical protein DEO72_LG8g1047 [Vigna unguiculata]|uniref:Uncharacterized protein n=1 Tax=Vigna unguiculata TaxID=3917 RepID=A0A4D6MNB8_VIGUN|nr:hypothetical protein DEO72_LG8g1047 [Vigna unguiculata]
MVKSHFLELLPLPFSARVPTFRVTLSLVFVLLTFHSNSGNPVITRFIHCSSYELGSRAAVLLSSVPKVLYEPISRKTMARPANLAQASQSRLGETNRDSPKPFYARGRPGDPLFFLSERASRPGERACNSLGSLGETSGVTLQWSGRNSMAPVSGCPWWCPICITRRPEIH